MTKEEILKLLQEISGGKISPDEGIEKLSHMPYAELDCANFDTHRPLRNGFTEVIYGESKSFEQILCIVDGLIPKGTNIFITRIDPEKAARLTEKFPQLGHDPVSRTCRLIQSEQAPAVGVVGICAAGTADISVAEEASKTLEFFGITSKKFYDVGVAGLHRLICKKDEIKNVNVLIVVAGMEGALPSVLGGMFPQPIVAVPTSVGYGTNFKGITPLMSMLNSCAEGITVVNIDNGFGAACAAKRIMSLMR